MLSKARLLNYLQELNQLITDDLSQEPLIQGMPQRLEQIRSDLESDKLNIYFLSTDIALAESFQQRFNAYPILTDIYQFRSHELVRQEVEEPKAAFSAFLSLQEQTESTCRYEFSTSPLLTVGREPGCDFCIPDYYTRVSGRHLEIHFCPSIDQNISHQWRVQNSDYCRNGTYINGKCLTESHILKSGDRLALGDRSPNSQSPELLFEHSIALEAIQSENRFSSNSFKDCTVFLIINSDHKSSEEAVLELDLSTLPINFFLVTFPAQTIQEIKSFQQLNSSENSFVELDVLCEQMASISPRKIAEHKVKDAVSKTIDWISKVEEALLVKKGPVVHQIELFEQQQSQRPQGRARRPSEDKSTLLRQISEWRSSLNEIVDVALEQSKQDLLDDSLVSSILHRISDEIDSMEAQIIKQDSKKFLVLAVKNCECNVNDYLIQFYEEELIDWANEEWEKTCSQYGGGIEGLIDRSQNILKPISENSGEYFAPSICQEPNLHSVFQVSLRKILDRIEYQPVSILSFSIKKIRSSVFQVMSVLFLLSFLGLSRGSFIGSVRKQISSSMFLIILTLGVVLWLFHKLYKSYQNDKKIEIQKVSDKIRLELKGYYQKTVKVRFAEKLTRKLKAAFKEETNRFERELRFYLDTTEGKLEQSITDRANPELFLREYRKQLTKLQNKLESLHKIRDRIKVNK